VKVRSPVVTVTALLRQCRKCGWLESDGLLVQKIRIKRRQPYSNTPSSSLTAYIGLLKTRSWAGAPLGFHLSANTSRAAATTANTATSTISCTLLDGTLPSPDDVLDESGAPAAGDAVGVGLGLRVGVNVGGGVGARVGVRVGFVVGGVDSARSAVGATVVASVGDPVGLGDVSVGVGMEDVGVGVGPAEVGLRVGQPREPAVIAVCGRHGTLIVSVCPLL